MPKLIDETQVAALDPESLRVFAEKGKEGGASIPQAGNQNGLKVRRVVQITRDLATRPIHELRVLDVACGEGVYSIEFGLRGAEVLGFDARDERMSHGMRCARLAGLENVQFQVADLRKVTRETHGEFDVVLFLGILYHLDVPDVFKVLEAMSRMCAGFMVVDTHVALDGPAQVEHPGRTYRGRWTREHGDADPPEVKRARVLMSIDNPRAFQFTRESVVRLLSDVGFTSVFECCAPLEPGKPEDRATFVAHKGTRVKLSTYHWVNDLSDDELASRVLQPAASRQPPPVTHTPSHGLAHVLKRSVQGTLRRLGYEIRRVPS